MAKRIISSLWDERIDLAEICGLEDELLSFCERHNVIYLVGAGVYAKLLNDYFLACGISVAGFLVTSKETDQYCSKPVYTIDQYLNKSEEGIGVVLALKIDYQKEILESHGSMFERQGIEVFKFNPKMAAYIKKILVNPILELIKKVDEWGKKYPIYETNVLNAREKWQTILVVQIEDAIGDTIWGSAFLRELRRNYPDGRITYVANKAMKTIVEECPYIDEIVYYPYVNKRYKTYEELEERVRSFVDKQITGVYDVVFLVKALPVHVRDQVENVLIALFSGAKHRVAHSFGVFDGEKFFDSLWEDLFPVRAISTVAEHDVKKDLSLLYICNLNIADDSMELWLSKQSISIARKVMNYSDGFKYIVFGLAGREHRRNWPGGNYLELADAIDQMYHGRVRIVLVGGENAVESAILIRNSKAEIIDLTAKLSLAESAAVVSMSDLYVGSDTSIMHMASASGKPVVELTANLKDGMDIDQGSIVRTGPWHVKSKTIFPKYALDDCKRRCVLPYTHCITQIRVEEVFYAIRELLGE